MKKIFIILFLLLCIIPQNSNTYALTNSQYYEQIILNEVKQNEKVQLSENELKKAILNTKGELAMIHSNVIIKGYKVTHKCYPNSVIKQVSIYTIDSVINRYYDAHGNWIGFIEYYYKDNALAKAYTSEDRPTCNSNQTQTSKINRIGGSYVTYNGGKIHRIGDMYVTYDGDKIHRIGDMYVTYNGNKIHRIGNMYVTYDGDKIHRIGDMYVTYNGNKISRIGDMYVSY